MFPVFSYPSVFILQNAFKKPFLLLHLSYFQILLKFKTVIINVIMNTVEISRSKIKDFLTWRLTHNVLQTEENDLFNVLRYESIGGYEDMPDIETFKNLVEAIPEFNLLEFYKSDEHNILLKVKPNYESTSDEIMVDIHRIIQTKF